MPAPASFLSALGSAFMGYGKDQQQRIENDRTRSLDQMTAQLHGAQMRQYDAETDQRRAGVADKARRQQVLSQFGKLAIQGDPDAIQQVISVAPELAPTLTKEPPKGQYDADRGVMIQPDGTYRPIPGLPAKPTPPVQPSFTPVTLDPGDGTPPVVKPFNTHSGTVGPAVGNAKPPVTRIESATNTAAKARLEAAISEMNNAHQGMDEFEGKLARGEVTINGLDQFIGRVGGAFTHDDPVSMGAQSLALSALNRSNPELARYIRRALSFAEGESMISQRPSDFRTKMTAFLSAAASGASPEMVQDIQSRRMSILTPLNRHAGPTPAPQPQAPPAPSGNVDLGAPHQPSHAQQLWDAAVAKHGQAKVLAEFGPRPQE